MKDRRTTMMQHLKISNTRLLAVGALLLLIGLASPCKASVPVSYVVEDIDPFDTSIVRNDGILVAMNAGDTAGFMVNGVDFQGITIPPAPNDLGGTVTGNGITLTYGGDIPNITEASYGTDSLNRYNFFTPQSLVNTADWGQCNEPFEFNCDSSGIMEVGARSSSAGIHEPDPDTSIEIDVSGLTIGKTYRLQFLMDLVAETRIMTIVHDGQSTPWLSTGELLTEGDNGLEGGAIAANFDHPGHDGLDEHGHSVLAEFTADATTATFSILATHFSRAVINAVALAEVTSPGLLGDFDGDTDVDGADFLLWQRDPSNKNLSDWENNYGSVSAGATLGVVPEPSSFGLAFLGIGWLAIRRKGT